MDGITERESEKTPDSAINIISLVAETANPHALLHKHIPGFPDVRHSYSHLVGAVTATAQIVKIAIGYYRWFNSCVIFV